MRQYTESHWLFCVSFHFQIPGVKSGLSLIPCIWRTKQPHVSSVVPPPFIVKAASLLWASVYVSLRVFPPMVLHPILLDKGTWASRMKPEWAREWTGTNWHVAFCEVSAQPLDRWLPFANEHSSLCVSPQLLRRMFFLLFSFVCAQSGRSTIGVLLIGRRTHE